MPMHPAILALAATAATAGLAAAAVLPAAAAAAPAASPPPINWAAPGGPRAAPFPAPGFAGYNAQGLQVASLTFVSADFKVPAVNCKVTPGPSYVAFWAGITDGTSLEQAGVTDFCGPKSGASYSAWWEMYPAGPQTAFAVHAGDTIDVTVTDLGINSSGNDVYALFVNDPTEGKHILKKEVCNTCTDVQAEVLAEGFSHGPWHGPADFGQVDFSHVVIDDDGVNPPGNIGQPPDNAWYVTEYDDVQTGSNGEEVTDMMPGPLTDHGASFSVKWLSDKV